ncbi:hypothetical protein CsSME_00009897 [Camellia sinensis var. sinensis]
MRKRHCSSIEIMIIDQAEWSDRSYAGLFHTVPLWHCACGTHGGKGTGDECEVDKEETLPQEVKEVKSQICSDHLATTINWEVNDGTSLEEGSTELAKERTNKIMQNFAKALWNVLKNIRGNLRFFTNTT